MTTMMERLYNVQYPDRNITAKDLPKARFLVKNVFATFQGEGPFAGQLAIFVRVAGCNRGNKHTGCEFCDTDFRLLGATEMYAKTLIDRIENVRNSAADLIYLQERWNLTVITGGEPLLYDEAMQEFMDQIWRRLPNMRVQIETNGDLELFEPNGFRANGDVDTRLAAEYPHRQQKLFIVVSPKVGSRGNFRKPRNWVMRRADAVKFLIDGRVDSPYYDIPRQEGWADFIDLHPQRVYLSPLAVYNHAVEKGEIASAWPQAGAVILDNLIDYEATRCNYRRAAVLARALGVRLSMQQHLFFAVE